MPLASIRRNLIMRRRKAHLANFLRRVFGQFWASCEIFRGPFDNPWRLRYSCLLPTHSGGFAYSKFLRGQRPSSIAGRDLRSGLTRRAWPLSIKTVSGNRGVGLVQG
jgi:hypothetical protein